MNKIIKYSILTLFSFTVTFGIVFGISNINAQPAQASTTCATTSVCISIHKGWVGKESSGGNGIGNGPGGGGGGGGGNNSTVTKPTPIPCVGSSNVTVVENGQAMPYSSTGWRKYSGCVKEYKIKTTFVPFGKPGGWCAVKKQGGVDIKAVGYINNYVEKAQFAQRASDKGSGDDLITTMFYSYKPYSTANNCIYPKVNSIVNNKYCALNTSVTFDRLANSRLGASRLKTIKKTITTVSKLQNGSGECKQSADIAFASGLKNNQNTWGQYKLAGNIQYAKCTQFKTSFDGKITTEYAKCKVAGNLAVQANATLWCGGVSKSLLNKTWTMNDCLGKSPSAGGFTCNVPQPVYDGKKGTVQTLRDGKSRVLNWGSPTTNSNVRNAKNWEQTVTVNKGSSPRLTSVGDNDKGHQMFWSNVSFGANWAKSKNQQNLAFYNASNPNGSWSATRKMRFDAQFKAIVGDIDSYNPWTGAIKTSKRTAWVNDYNINCKTAVSPKIQALRSIGDVQ